MTKHHLQLNHLMTCYKRSFTTDLWMDWSLCSNNSQSYFVLVEVMRMSLIMLFYDFPFCSRGGPGGLRLWGTPGP